MYGYLIYNDAEKRFDITGLNDGCVEVEYGGLHCGTALEVFKEGKWVETRIEYDGETDEDVFGWYFVGVGRCAPLVGHKVRI